MIKRMKQKEVNLKIFLWLKPTKKR